MTQASVHSRLSPSSAYRWTQCAGSANLCQEMPNTTSIYAEQGTRLHIASAETLERLKNTVSFVNEEEMEAVEQYTNFVKSIKGELHVEVKLSGAKFHSDFRGTADAVVVDYEQNTLTVIDAKFGWGFVSIENTDRSPNLQLMHYLMYADAFFGKGKKFSKYEIIIVQPFAGGVKRRIVTLSELSNFTNQAIVAALRTDNNSNEFVLGGHCKFCPAKIVCPAMQEISRSAVEMGKQINSLGEEEVMVMNAGANIIAKALEEAQYAKMWLDALDSHAEAMLKDGVNIQGWGLIPKRAVKKWRNEDEVKIAVEQLNLVDAAYDTLLKSPAQLKTLLKQKKIAYSLDELIISESSGVKLGRTISTSALDDFKLED